MVSSLGPHRNVPGPYYPPNCVQVLPSQPTDNERVWTAMYWYFNLCALTLLLGFSVKWYQRWCNMIWLRAVMQEMEKELIHWYQRDYGPRQDLTCAWTWLQAENYISRENQLPLHLLLLCVCCLLTLQSDEELSFSLIFSLFIMQCCENYKSLSRLWIIGVCVGLTSLFLSTGQTGLKIRVKNITLGKSLFLLATHSLSLLHSSCFHPQKIALRNKAYVLWE